MLCLLWVSFISSVFGYYNYHYSHRWDEPHWYKRIRHMDRVSRHIVFPTEYLHPDGVLRTAPPRHPYYHAPIDYPYI